MFKKLLSLVLLLFLCVSFWVPTNAVAAADTVNAAIILEVGSADSDDITDLRYGKGKVYKKIVKAIEHLKEEGVISENAQPVIAIVKKK